MKPYYEADGITIYHGDCRKVLPALDLPHVGVVIADPPYGETSLRWDRWPDGWVTAVAGTVRESCSLWCFGSLRMFLEHGSDFAGWQLAQDLVWRKQNGTGFATDRFRRVHEHVTHWYRGPWSRVHHVTPRVAVAVREHNRSIKQGGGHARHLGHIGDRGSWTDDGTRLTPSVLEVSNMWRKGAIHPTQKPLGIIEPLLRYSLAPGGTVLDPFAGSCSTLVAAREAGYRAIGIEADEAMCARAVEHRLAQGALTFGGSS